MTKSDKSKDAQESREQRAKLLHKAASRAESAGDDERFTELYRSMLHVRSEIRRHW